jgi:hypothetical protein
MQPGQDLTGSKLKEKRKGPRRPGSRLTSCLTLFALASVFTISLAILGTPRTPAPVAPTASVQQTKVVQPPSFTPAFFIATALYAFVANVPIRNMDVQALYDGLGMKRYAAKFVDIQWAVCGIDQSGDGTGIYISGITNMPVEELVGGSSLTLPVASDGPGGFRFNPLIAMHANKELCPKTAIIMTKDGHVLASAPIQVLEVP